MAGLCIGFGVGFGRRNTLSASFSVSIGAGPFTTGALLTATVNGLQGGETVTYQWTDDGVNITGATASTYTAAIGTDGIADASQIRCVATVDGTPYTSSAREIRYAAGTAPAVADGQAWTVDDTSVSLDGSASGANLTFSYALTGSTAGVTINSGSGLITGTPTGVDSGTATITATDQYGRELTDTFTWTASLRTQATAAGLLELSFAELSAITPVDLSTDWTANGNTLTFSELDTLPGSLDVAANGTLSGTTPAAQADANFTVRATDEYGRTTDSEVAIEITVGLTAPVITGVPTISGTEVVGQTLTASAASVSGNPTPTRTWQWERAGTPIIGETSSTYTLASADEGQTLTVVQTETNSEGSDNAESAATGAIGSVPAITGVPTISGTEAEGQTLTASPASVTGTPTPTRTWQWERGGTPISGATSISYVLVSADVGQTLTVVQTETNANGADTAESAATGTISGAAPTLDTFSFTQGAAGELDTVSSTASGDTTGYSKQLETGNDLTAGGGGTVIETTTVALGTDVPVTGFTSSSNGAGIIRATLTGPNGDSNSLIDTATGLNFRPACHHLGNQHRWHADHRHQQQGRVFHRRHRRLGCVWCGRGRTDNRQRFRVWNHHHHDWRQRQPALER